MDAEGFWRSNVECRKDVTALKAELPSVLESAIDPALLVLQALQGVYGTSTGKTEKKVSSLGDQRRACSLLLESLLPLLANPTMEVEWPVESPSFKEQARVTANKWKSRIDVDADPANAAKPLEVQAFLQLVATFGIAADFPKDELYELALAVSWRRQIPKLCGALRLTEKMLGFMCEGGEFEGGNGIGGSDANDQRPFYRSTALSFAVDLGWSESYHGQKLFPPLPPPVRQEIGDPTASGPMLLQKFFENHSAPYQVQITQISGKTILQWIYSLDLVQNLKVNLERRFGIPSALQRLIFQGKQLDDPLPLSSYSIKNNSSLVFSLRLRGGAAGQSSSAPPFSYKAALHFEIPISPKPPKPKPFLVDKVEEVPSVEISHPDLADDFQKFAERAIICIFHRLWPRSKDLYDWINENWTHHCKVFFCSKGYFIVLFDSPKHYEKALEEGPWFMGSAGLFLTPWLSNFDPASRSDFQTFQLTCGIQQSIGG